MLALGCKKWLLVPPLLLAVGLFLAVGCGGGSDGDKGGAAEGSGEEQDGELFVDPDAPVIDVALTEWALAPDAATAEAGPVTFSARNEGKAAHELVVVKTDTAADKLEAKNGKVDEDTAGEMIGEIEQFDAGKTLAKTFDLVPGHYVLLCNIEGHYGSGMHADFTVE